MTTGISAQLTIFLSMLAVSEELELHLIHTSEVMYTFTPTNIFGGLCSGNSSGCSGGVGRHKNIIDKIRRDNRNVLLLDSGNYLEPNAWYRHYGKNLSTEVREAFGYDAMLPGINELLLGEPDKDPKMKSYMTCLNCRGAFQEYILIKKFGVNIGIFGILSLKFAKWTISQQRTEDDIKNKIAYFRRKLNISVIILLSHSRIDENVYLADKYPNIDVIIGGFGGALLYTGINPEPGLVTGPYPLVSSSHRGTSLIAHSGMNGKFIGHLKLYFNDNGELLDWKDSTIKYASVADLDHVPHIFDNKLKQDFKNKLDAMENMTEHLGNSFDFMSRELCWNRNCPLADILCNALLENANAILKFYYNDPRFIHYCITVGYFIRRSITPGSINIYQLSEIFSFHIEYVSIELTGYQIMNLFEKSFVGNDTFTGMVLHGRGLEMKFDNERTAGRKIYDMKVWRCYGCRYFVPIKQWRKYRVLLPAFFIEPQLIRYEPFFMSNFNSSHILFRGVTDYSSMVRYLRLKTNIYVPLAGNYDLREPTPAWIPEALLCTIINRIDHLSILLTSLLSIVSKFQ